MDFYAAGVPLDRFNWGFIKSSQSAWPAAHVVNPFMIYMFSQRTWLTLLWVYAFEAIEPTILTFTGQTYLIFIGDKPEPEAESPSDSAIGDVLGGVLGLLLAKLVSLVYMVPEYYAPSVWSPDPYFWITFKRAVMFLLVEPAFLWVNAAKTLPGDGRLRYGVLVSILWIWCVGELARRWNWTSLERDVYWRGKEAVPHDRHRGDYDHLYTAWFGTAIFILASTLGFITYGYIQVWTAWLIMCVLHLYVLAFQGRFWELWYNITCGPQRSRYYDERIMNVEPVGDRVVMYGDGSPR